MKKTVLTFLLALCISQQGLSQEKIEKTYDAWGMQNIDLSFKYPELVRIKTWDKQEVKISALIDIDEGKGNNKFRLEDQSGDDGLRIYSVIEDIEQLGRFVVPSPDGDQVNTRVNYRGKQRNCVEVSVQLEITVPAKIPVQVESIYGMVEIVDSPVSMEVDARYGGIDAVIQDVSSRGLLAKTQWGQIYSNLDVTLDLNGNPGVGDWMKAVVASKQDGTSLYLASQYGNVYLRKAGD